MKNAAIFLVLLCFNQLVWAQKTDTKDKEKSKPDFSGEWVLDNSKSGLSGAVTGKLNDVNLTVVHRGQELKVTETIKNGARSEAKELVYYSDGRGETNHGKKTVTKWDKETLVIKQVIEVAFATTGRRSPSKVEVAEKWQLSKDGKTLTRTMTNRPLDDAPPAIANLKVTMVFTRAEKIDAR